MTSISAVAVKTPIVDFSTPIAAFGESFNKDMQIIESQLKWRGLDGEQRLSKVVPRLRETYAFIMQTFQTLQQAFQKIGKESDEKVKESVLDGLTTDLQVKGFHRFYVKQIEVLPPGDLDLESLDHLPTYISEFQEGAFLEVIKKTHDYVHEFLRKVDTAVFNMNCKLNRNQDVSIDIAALRSHVNIFYNSMRPKANLKEFEYWGPLTNFKEVSPSELQSKLKGLNPDEHDCNLVGGALMNDVIRSYREDIITTAIGAGVEIRLRHTRNFFIHLRWLNPDPMRRVVPVLFLGSEDIKGSYWNDPFSRHIPMLIEFGVKLPSIVSKSDTEEELVNFVYAGAEPVDINTLKFGNEFLLHRRAAAYESALNVRDWIVANHFFTCSVQNMTLLTSALLDVCPQMPNVLIKMMIDYFPQHVWQLQADSIVDLYNRCKERETKEKADKGQHVIEHCPLQYIFPPIVTQAASVTTATVASLK